MTICWLIAEKKRRYLSCNVEGCRKHLCFSVMTFIQKVHLSRSNDIERKLEGQNVTVHIRSVLDFYHSVEGK